MAVEKMYAVVPILVAVGVGAGLWILWNKKSKKPGPLQRVGTVSSLLLYPVKSLPAVSLKQAECSGTGLKVPGGVIKDRHLVVTNKDYNFLTLRQEPSLARIQVSLHDDEIHLEAAGLEKLIVPGAPAPAATCTVRIHGFPISAADCGEEAGQWISAFLKMDGAHLCISAPGQIKRILKECPKEPFKTYFKKAKDEDEIIFPDVTPYMVLSDSSLEDLNARLGESLTMRSFRPNITISGTSPFEDDTWKTMKIGEARFTFIMQCGRCLLTTVDPDTGEKRADQEPLKTLRKYRLVDKALENSPCFGSMWVLDHPGTIKVGDPVYASKA